MQQRRKVDGWIQKNEEDHANRLREKEISEAQIKAANMVHHNQVIL
jgi:hypothetical protein